MTLASTSMRIPYRHIMAPRKGFKVRMEVRMMEVRMTEVRMVKVRMKEVRMEFTNFLTAE